MLKSRLCVWMCEACVREEMAGASISKCAMLIYHKTKRDADDYCNYARSAEVTDCGDCCGMKPVTIEESLWAEK